VSLNIWTLCAGPSSVRPLALTVWRVVEAQHRVSTRQLVDTLEEQQILEEIIEEVKPPRPESPGFAMLHFLLMTPFRRPPLLHGSRFGRRDERSLFYSAEKVETALAEKAYYQLVFLAGTRADMPKVTCDWTAFSVEVATRRGIDLTAAPFDRYRSAISSPMSYRDSQPLGRAMRAAGVEAFTFHSARSPGGGINVALFEPVFATRKPRQQHTWRCEATVAACELFALASSTSRVLAFARAQFEVDGILPFPAGG